MIGKKKYNFCCKSNDLISSKNASESNTLEGGYDEGNYHNGNGGEKELLMFGQLTGY